MFRTLKKAIFAIFSTLMRVARVIHRFVRWIREYDLDLIVVSCFGFASIFIIIGDYQGSQKATDKYERILAVTTSPNVNFTQAEMAEYNDAIKAWGKWQKEPLHSWLVQLASKKSGAINIWMPRDYFDYFYHKNIILSRGKYFIIP